MGGKKAVAVGILLILAVNSFLTSQDTTGQGEKTGNAGNTSSAITNDTLFNSDTELSLGVDETTSSQPAKSSKFGTFFLFLRMIIVLAFVVACIYAVMWFMKRSMKTNPADNDPFLRKVASVDVAVGKSVQIVTVLDKAYLIGVADSSVNLISEIQDKELIDAMNLYADEHQNVKKPRNFADVLDIFMPNGPREKGGVFSENQSKVSEMLEKQRNRLKGEK